jgi:hypothetical protein
MAWLEPSIGWIGGLAAALLQAAGFCVMARAILLGSVRPNQCSWLIWSVVATLAAAGSWQAGATWPLGGAVMNAVGCFGVLLLSLRHGEFAANRVDTTCLLAAALGLAAWLGTDDPVLGLVLFLAADACGALPTIRNVLVDPARESAAGWALLAAAGCAAVLSVEPQQWSWSWAGFGYWGGAAYVALVNIAVTAAITLARAGRGLPATAAASAAGRADA